MPDTVTLPRSVVEQAMKLLDALSYDENYDYDGCFRRWSDYAKPETLSSQLRAALEQPPVNSPEIPEGWKLVPEEPTTKMIDAARSQSSFPAGVWRAMLAAAPQPPVVEQPQPVTDCHQSQPQGEQEPA